VDEFDAGVVEIDVIADPDGNESAIAMAGLFDEFDTQ
jgi:hypothetical protein